MSKEEEVKKAVTSEVVIQDDITDEATASGESKPTIEDAKSLADLNQQQAAPEVAEVSQPYSLGATLVQTPDGNIFSNFKPSPIDYVEAAKPKGIITMSAEELQNLDPKMEKSEPELDLSEFDGVLEKASPEAKEKMKQKLMDKMAEAKKSGDMKTYKACQAMCGRMEKSE